MTPLARRSLLLLSAAAALAFSAEPDARAKPQWPLWDGQETIEHYAQRAGLEPTKTLDLGNGVKLELVLIPAGEFVMGTAEPVKPPEPSAIGQVIFWFCGAAGIVLLFYCMLGKLRTNRPTQFSLRVLLTAVLLIAAGLLGLVRAGQARLAQAEYEAALERYGHNDDNEKPAHKVTLTTPFYIGKYEITQEQWQQVIGVYACDPSIRLLPAYSISWLRAQDFCAKLGEATRLVVRLPTEAQWEYACRAGTKSAYNTGDTDSDLDRSAWQNSNGAHAYHPVGMKQANSWGVYDMHGNVAEWCQDFSAPYTAATEIDPLGPPEGKTRILRGGSYNTKPVGCRSAARYSSGPSTSCMPNLFRLGFRVAVSVSPKDPNGK